MDIPKDLIRKCRADIINKFVGSERFKLKHSDLLKLSDEIFEATNISISLSTLKRFFKESVTTSPQPSTLDAFAKYLGYDHWNDYVKNTISTRTRKSGKRRKFFLTSKGFFLTSGFLLIACFLFIYLNFILEKKNDYESIEFYYTIENDTSMPSTVVFHYNIKNIEFKEAQIWPLGYGGDANDIKHEDSIALYTYGWFDTFRPKLVIDDSIVRELTLDVQSHSWMAAVNNLTKTEFFTEYLEDEEIFSNGELGITDEILKSHNFTYNDIDRVYYCFAGNFKDIDGDTLIYETRIKSKQIHKNEQSGIHMVKLAFEKGIIQIPLTEKTFNMHIPFIFHEIWMAADKNDLSFFSIKHQEWNTIKIATSSKRASITINGSEVFSQAYTNESGFLKRIEFIFFGLGEVDYVRFYSPENELIYNDEFD